MQKYFASTLVFVFTLSICCVARGVSSEIKEKYPNVLMTDDYSILNENDLASYAKGIRPQSFLEIKKNDFPFRCWQCFPRDDVRITFDDKGYSTDDSGKESNCSEITITAQSGASEHKYHMRRYTSVDTAKLMFDYWRKLMKNEKHVCLAGEHDFVRKKTSDNRMRIKHYWTFDRIKTKKGCDSYFSGQCK